MNKYERTRRKIVKNYYDDLIKNRNKIMILDKWCEDNLDMESIFGTKNKKKVNSFQKIVVVDLDKLIEVKKYIDKHNVKMDKKLKDYMITTMYGNIDRIKFVNTLEVKVCPYCNRNYINSSKNKTYCQFDHFINKKNYPILAASFYNLVPVCPSCNHVKSDADFSYSPYDNTIKTDDIITFSYILKGIDYLNDNSKIEILLQSDDKLKLNVEILKLKDLYQIHSDIVQELIKKKEIYTDDYVEQLNNRFNKLFDSKYEIERLILGAYTSEQDYGKRPLSKMITDISKELNLIKGK